MSNPRKPPDQVLRPSLVVDEDVFYHAEVSFGPTLAEVMLAHAAGRLRQVDLARLLAVITALHQQHSHVPARYQSADNVPVPREIVEILGELLTSKEQWAAEQNRLRTKMIPPELMQEIDAYRRQNPTASKRRIAKRFGVPRKKI